jgi:hypothetical protein
VPLHKRREGGIVSGRDEALQQLPIGHASPVPQKGRSAETAEDVAHFAGCHGTCSLVGNACLLFLLEAEAPARRFFLEYFHPVIIFPATIFA